MGNPIVVSTGNKIEPEQDFASGGEMALYLERTWNQHWDGVGLFGRHWLSNFDYRLSFGTRGPFGCYAGPGWAECTNGETYNEIWAHRPDGRMIKFLKGVDGVYREDKPSPISTMVRQVDGSWLVTFEDNLIELYSKGGYPLWIQDEHGLKWTYSYGGLNNTQAQRVTHSSGRYVQFAWVGYELREVRDPANTLYSYSYIRTPHYLKTTTRPGLLPTVITYHYNLEQGEPAYNFTALTGKSYNGMRYSRFTYSTSLGYATSTEHAQGVERHTFVYTPGANGALTVLQTNPLGKQTTYDFLNSKLLATTGHPSPNCPAMMASDTTYDANGYEDKVSDFKGNKTDYNYDAHGHLLTWTEAFGTPLARLSTNSWDETKNRITSTIIAGETETAYSYTTDNRIDTITVKNVSSAVPASQNQTRLTNYDYTKHANGVVATMIADGPMPGDTVTYTYNTSGDLLEIRNSLNHATTYSNHNALGLPGRMVGPNGDITEHLYDVRGRVTSEKRWVNNAWQTTTYGYDGLGRLVTIQQPDGQTRTWQYDLAWRVSTISEPEPGGTYAQTRYVYNNASQPIAIHTERLDGAPSMSAQFVSQNVPASFRAYDSALVTVRMTNTGTSPWTTLDGYALGSQNPQDNTIWGLNRVPVTGTIQPGQTAVFDFVIGSNTTGNKNFQWRMVKNDTEWFGPSTPNAVISVLHQPCPACLKAPQSGTEPGSAVENGGEK